MRDSTYECCVCHTNSIIPEQRSWATWIGSAACSSSRQAQNLWQVLQVRPAARCLVGRLVHHFDEKKLHETCLQALAPKKENERLQVGLLSAADLAVSEACNRSCASPHDQGWGRIFRYKWCGPGSRSAVDASRHINVGGALPEPWYEWTSQHDYQILYDW